MHDNADLAERFLDVIANDILPLTRRGVAAGNKVFGAALLRKSDLSLVMAETNNEIENPLWHGEMHLLKRYYERSERPNASELLFLSTHEPCSLCLSAITWAGFDNFYYLFTYEVSRDAFAIPHDLRILKEVFTLDPGGYNKTNAFWESAAIGELIERSPNDKQARLRARVQGLHDAYAELSGAYQTNKGDNDIPLA